MSWLITPQEKTDADALAYIARVELADGQALETGVRTAIIDFVTGCKSDGIWDAIKASCIMAGARTLNGALQPLVGMAPTNFNFVSGDYNRKTGLVGNGSTKYLDSNRNNNADPQDSNHNAAFATSVPPQADADTLMGTGDVTTDGANNILFGGGTFSRIFVWRSRNSTFDGTSLGTGAFNPGFYGMSRANASSYVTRLSGSNTSYSRDSQAPLNASVLIFARSDGTNPGGFATSRIAFYSIGEALDLALLDARVTALINAFGTAIP